ncbi:uncharacterized protein LOC122717273 [Apis laboriosa]|uniref:uncharacterized protein LOC122717273 n=1 Tax=Apis laboriosa TaxID=183418 RepID=UPI001CC39FAC|nr:uncharacterized protein LOC122717273 [Apis laboriosa]
MDILPSANDIIFASSQYGSMAMFLKRYIIDIKAELEKRSKKYSETLSQRYLRDENFEKILKLWRFEMDQYFTELEFYWRAIILRTFFYPSNYLHILRSPLKIDKRYNKIQIHNITFPMRNEEYQLSSMLHEMRKKLKPRCTGRYLIKHTICGNGNN